MHRRYYAFSLLPPQEQTVLHHLLRDGTITNVEAQTVHKIRSLSRRITTLTQSGCAIARRFKTDAAGQRYVRYYLDYCPAQLKPKEVPCTQS